MALKIISISMASGGSRLEHIAELKTEHGTVFTREKMYNTIKDGKKYAVNIDPFPKITTAISSNGTRYVRSEADNTGKDNLLKLPRF